MAGRIIAVVGPSGVGKDSVMQAMAKSRPGLKLARRIITRPSQAGGEDFKGVSDAQFKAMCKAGAFSIWWSAHGLSYGIPTVVETALAEGHDILANLSRGVLMQAKEQFKNLAVISLTTCPEILEARLSARGREDAAEITRRLDRATKPLPCDIKAIELDNSGALDETVRDALAMLYPVGG